ncbi:MAG: LysE family transporter [Candidatus Hydrothermarchaeales archaeon]
METIYSNIYLFLAAVVFISLSGVLSPGPVFAVTIAKGRKDRNAGILISVGHGVIEFPLMILIYLGFSKFFTGEGIKTVIGIGGGLMLFYMGLEMIKVRKKMSGEGKDLPYGSVFAGFFTTTSNPYFFLWWATIGATLIVAATGFGVVGFLLFMVVHWSCDLVWYSFVSRMVNKSAYLWSGKAHEVIFGGCGLFLIGFGLWFIASVI